MGDERRLTLFLGMIAYLTYATTDHPHIPKIDVVSYSQVLCRSDEGEAPKSGLINDLITSPYTQISVFVI